MSVSINAYPLSWPESFPRSKARGSSQFKTSLAGALRNVQDSLRRFATDSGKKLENIIISSNVTLGADRPTDPGVAVWFVWDGMQLCVPVDRYAKVEDNLQAIHHIIEARRTELRHGTLALVRATFSGFRSLPAPPGKKSWREVFGLKPEDTVHVSLIESLYRYRAKKAHPDQGGTHEAMAELNRAREDALKEIAQ